MCCLFFIINQFLFRVFYFPIVIRHETTMLTTSTINDNPTILTINFSESLKNWSSTPVIIFLGLSQGTPYYTQVASNLVYTVNRRWLHAQNTSQVAAWSTSKSSSQVSPSGSWTISSKLSWSQSEWDSKINVLALLGYYAETWSNPWYLKHWVCWMDLDDSPAILLPLSSRLGVELLDSKRDWGWDKLDWNLGVVLLGLSL